EFNSATARVARSASALFGDDQVSPGTVGSVV
ncbi:MAG: hypothetical protein QOE41_1874, partial [Mycobacterium sp.]|nr:hypothetical protein [Mycobacterium sp.]